MRPYEVKGHPFTGEDMLYATEDNKHGPSQIHSFAYVNIQDADPLRGTHFDPRGPTQPGSL